MANFPLLIANLDAARRLLAQQVRNLGVLSCTDSMSLRQIAQQMQSIQGGIQHVRSAHELFTNNTDITSLTFVDFTPIKDLYKMCSGCTSLTYANLYGLSEPTDMRYAFYGCESLESIDNINTTGITSANEMFHGCKNLHTIGGALDFSSVSVKIETTFVTCPKLANVSFTGTIGVDIAMNGCRALTVDSLLSLFDALVTYSSGTHTCKIGSVNINKLSTAQKAIATNKGWTLE